MNTIIYTTIDLREFYPIVQNEIEKYGYLSAREIKSNNQPLIDSMLSALFFIKRNLNIVVGTTGYSHLLLYYSLDDFIEIYDDLQIAFCSFLNEKGIVGTKTYNVYRPDNFRTVFIHDKRVLYL